MRILEQVWINNSCLRNKQFVHMSRLLSPMSWSVKNAWKSEIIFCLVLLFSRWSFPGTHNKVMLTQMVSVLTCTSPLTCTRRVGEPHSWQHVALTEAPPSERFFLHEHYSNRWNPWFWEITAVWQMLYRTWKQYYDFWVLIGSRILWIDGSFILSLTLTPRILLHSMW